MWWLILSNLSHWQPPLGSRDHPNLAHPKYPSLRHCVSNLLFLYYNILAQHFDSKYFTWEEGYLTTDDGDVTCVAANC